MDIERHIEGFFPVAWLARVQLFSTGTAPTTVVAAVGNQYLLFELFRLGKKCFCQGKHTLKLG